MRSTTILPALPFLALFSALAIAGEVDLQEWIDARKAEGMSLGISLQWQRGEETGSLAFGQEPSMQDSEGGESVEGKAVDGQTRFEIGSITKVFTHLLLAESIAGGAVTDDTTLAELLDQDVTFSQPEVGKITLRELATHTSGLPRLPTNFAPSDSLDPYADYDEKPLVFAVKSARALQPLNKKYAYSNFGVGLEGYLLGKLHGSNYETALREQILDPLSLKRTDFGDGADLMPGYQSGRVLPVWHFQDALGGVGGLRSCTDDLMRLARWGMASTESATPLQLDPSRTRSVIGPASSGFEITPVWHVGYSGDAPIYFHNGATGGSRSFVGFRPDTAQAIALLVSGEGDPTEVGLKWLGSIPRLPSLPAVDRSIVGHYRLSEAINIEISVVGGQMFIQLTRQPPLNMEPMEEDWYSLSLADASVHILRDGDSVTGLNLVQFGRRLWAERLEEAPERETEEAITLPDQVLDEYIGEYSLSAAMVFTIRKSDEGLESQLTGQPFFPIFARAKDEFFYRVVEAELHFDRDEEGQITAVVLHQNGRKLRANRLNSSDP